MANLSGVEAVKALAAVLRENCFFPVRLKNRF
jgi:hypothetical protein